MFERNSQSRSMYRSVRYRVSRENSTRTADPSACNFRIKRNSCYDTTMARTGNSQLQSITITAQFKHLLKTDYLQTFNSMMDKKQLKKKKQKQKQVPFFNAAKITIPDFLQAQKQVQHSQFTLLQPITQPLHHVESLTVNSQREMQRQRNEMAEIKAGLRHTKEKTVRQLKGIKKYAEDQFEAIRNTLRKNETQQQQRKLKIKRELQQLQKNQEKNREKFGDIVNRNSSMQMCIFNSTPYNLRIREEEDQTFI